MVKGTPVVLSPVLQWRHSHREVQERRTCSWKLPAPVFTRNSGSGNAPIVCTEIDGWRCLLLLGRFCIFWIWMECLASALVRRLDESYQRQTITYKSIKRLYGNKRATLTCVLQTKTNGWHQILVIVSAFIRGIYFCLQIRALEFMEKRVHLISTSFASRDCFYMPPPRAHFLGHQDPKLLRKSSVFYFVITQSAPSCII